MPPSALVPESARSEDCGEHGWLEPLDDCPPATSGDPGAAGPRDASL